MGTIVTKYSVGDTVFHAWTGQTTKQHPCPDCKGAREWKAVSPAGREYSFRCPRCTGVLNNRSLSLSYQAHVPSVRKLTIGSIEARTVARWGGDDLVSYMCEETGVGSGTTYRETDLHPTHEEATAAAQAKADLANSTTDWIVKQYDETLSLSEYQISDATKKAAEDADRTRRVRVDMLFDDLRGCETIEEVQERLERGLVEAEAP